MYFAEKKASTTRRTIIKKTRILAIAADQMTFKIFSFPHIHFKYASV